MAQQNTMLASMKVPIRKSLFRNFCKLAKNNRVAQRKIQGVYLFETGACDALYKDLQNELKKKVYTDKNRAKDKRSKQPVSKFPRNPRQYPH
jgi:hypothetical protein